LKRDAPDIKPKTDAATTRAEYFKKFLRVVLFMFQDPFLLHWMVSV